MCVAGAKRGKARGGVSRLVWSSLVDDSLWYSQTTVTLFVCQSTCDWRFRFPRELRSRHHRSTLQPESDKKRLILESLEKLGESFQFLSWRFPRPPKMIQSNLLQKANNTGIREKPLDGQWLLMFAQGSCPLVEVSRDSSVFVPII